MFRYFVYVCVLSLHFNLSMCAVVSEKTHKPRVCVIGAGIAGLSSSRYLKQEGINFTVLECTRYIGGTWRYDPRVGVDENGLPLHTSMYKHLRTNLPKPVMQFSGFPLSDDLPSFPGWHSYYNYLKAFTKHFDLEKYIKFLHEVVSVKRQINVWKVKYRHVITGEEFNEDYDFVIVGTGHHSKPNKPVMKGEHLFKGTKIHSHDYREPTPYKGRRVLMIGAGPSGMEISQIVVEIADILFHSHHSPANFKTPFPSNYIKKPDVEEFVENGVVFTDGSFEEIDDVIFCTGYELYYPFLDETSGLTLTGRSVYPLYKHMVNINEPTMVVMGLVVRACIVVAIEAQARYATALIKGNFTLPPKEVMLEEWQARADALVNQKRPLSHIHILANNEDAYYAELTEESGISRVPPVLYKIRASDLIAKLENLNTYRNYEYTIVDNETFATRLEQKLERNSTAM